jgi:hypothetical protein
MKYATMKEAAGTLQAIEQVQSTLETSTLVIEVGSSSITINVDDAARHVMDEAVQRFCEHAKDEAKKRLDEAVTEYQGEAFDPETQSFKDGEQAA